MCCIMLCCVMLCCIVLYCIVLYCIVLYCIVLYCIVLYCIVLHLLHYIVLLLALLPNVAGINPYVYFIVCDKRVDVIFSV